MMTVIRFKICIFVFSLVSKIGFSEVILQEQTSWCFRGYKTSTNPHSCEHFSPIIFQREGIARMSGANVYCSHYLLCTFAVYLHIFRNFLFSRLSKFGAVAVEKKSQNEFPNGQPNLERKKSNQKTCLKFQVQGQVKKMLAAFFQYLCKKDSYPNKKVKPINTKKLVVL